MIWNGVLLALVVIAAVLWITFYMVGLVIGWSRRQKTQPVAPYNEKDDWNGLFRIYVYSAIGIGILMAILESAGVVDLSPKPKRDPWAVIKTEKAAPFDPDAFLKATSPLPKGVRQRP